VKVCCALSLSFSLSLSLSLLLLLLLPLLLPPSLLEEKDKFAFLMLSFPIMGFTS